MNWYIEAIKQYATFSGRARRKEYWMFYLFYAIFAVMALIADAVLETEAVYLLYVLAMFIPGLAVSVRRLHDVGKSGWMFLIMLIPLIGAIWLLILMVTEGEPRINQYGQNPKEVPVS